MLRTIQARLDAAYDRRVREHRAFLNRIHTGTMTALDQFRLSLTGRLGGDLTKPPVRKKAAAVSANYRRWHPCRTCGDMLYGIGLRVVLLGPVPEGGAGGAAAEVPCEGPRRSRRTCEHCRDDFLPARSDSRYCSVLCRVAAHRAAGWSA